MITIEIYSINPLIFSVKIVPVNSVFFCFKNNLMESTLCSPPFAIQHIFLKTIYYKYKGLKTFRTLTYDLMSGERIQN